MVAAEEGGPVEEGVGESSSPPREDAAAPAPAGSGGGSGGGARDICAQVLERLVADGHAEASDPDFRDRLAAHFGRLPHSYQLDINVDKAADVLVHQNVLAEAKDPDRRPAFYVRFLRIEDMDPAYDSDASEEGDDDGDDLSVRQDTPYTHIHEVVFSTIDKPKLLSQLSALLSDIGLNIREAHVFSTHDGYSLDVFVVDGWPIEDTDGLHKALEASILRNELEQCFSLTTNQRTVLSAMAFQRSERALNVITGDCDMLALLGNKHAYMDPKVEIPSAQVLPFPRPLSSRFHPPLLRLGYNPHFG